MNANVEFYPRGTRVFFWDAYGHIKYGTVERTGRLADGTQVVDIKLDDNKGGLSLPVSSVSKVN